MNVACPRCGDPMSGDSCAFCDGPPTYVREHRLPSTADDYRISSTKRWLLEIMLQRAAMRELATERPHRIVFASRVEAQPTGVLVSCSLTLEPLL